MAMWCSGSSLFCFVTPPRIWLSSRRVVVARHTGLLFYFFLSLALFPPPRGGALGEAPRSSCFWSVCSPRGRNGADSLIPDGLVFAFAFLFFFFLLSLHTKRRLGGNRVGRREGSMGWDGMDSSTPAGFSLALRYKGLGGYIHIHITLVLGVSFCRVVSSADGLYVVQCNLNRAALGPGEGALDCVWGSLDPPPRMYVD